MNTAATLGEGKGTGRKEDSRRCSARSFNLSNIFL